MGWLLLPDLANANGSEAPGIIKDRMRVKATTSMAAPEKAKTNGKRALLSIMASN